MIVHVVPESAEVSSCGLRNISRTAYNVYGGARVTDVPPYIIIIYRLRTFNSSMWGSLRLAPTSDMQGLVWGEPELPEDVFSSC